MNANDVARRIASCLDEDQLLYGIGGALALGIWGVPRATKDVDLTVFAEEHDLPRVLDSLERSGVMLDRAAATSSVARIGMFKGRLGLVPVDVFVMGHPQYDAMRGRLREIDDGGGPLRFISPEDLVIHKLLFGRLKDVADLERLFAVRTDLDLAYVRSWLVQMIPAGDRRLAVLDDLEQRFARRP